MSDHFTEQTTEALWMPSPGPYLAVVTGNQDALLMGALEVMPLEGTSPDSKVQGFTCTVKYLPPFWGTTPSKYEGNNSASFDDVQKSYGMWMVPPDPGQVVVVIFIGGNRNAGFWLGVVPDPRQNHMVPGIAASEFVALTPEQERKYGTKRLPVAEFSKRNRDLSNPKADEYTKPVHPFADRLLAQGLLLDDIRGITSSSARREHPSQVFGISTPGPVDTGINAPKHPIGYDSGKFVAFTSRLGGHSLVMDDGDKKGLNELFRIRTRTGHQILLHNSSDLIYIANAAGTAWIELTSSGKIDIYAADSVSIHAEGDFNLRADRDFNIEAKRNINLAAGGDIHSDLAGSYIVNADRDAMFTIGGSGDWKSSTLAIQSENDIDITAGDEVKITAPKAFDVKTATLRLDASGNLSLKSQNLIMSATQTASIKGDQEITLYGQVLNLNAFAGPTAPAANSAALPDTASKLPIYSLPNTSWQEGWSDGVHFKAEDIQSIMKRVPTHEPYQQHENLNPQQFSYDNTDLDVDNRGRGLPGKKPTIVYNNNPQTSGTPPTPTGDAETDNIAAFLWMIRVCEGTSGPTGYRTMYTGALFDPDSPTIKATNSYTQKFEGQVNKAYQWKDHPRLAIVANITSGVTGQSRAVPSTAAGAYQFLSSTWDSCARALELKDFTEASQDKAAIYLLKNVGALDNVKKGEFTKAIAKTKRIWASLPGSPYDQNPKSFNVALQYYKQGGGTFVA